MKTAIVAASAVLLGSAAAAQHRAHPAFHQRYYAQDVCTVYTTVYVQASELPPAVANSTVYAVPTPIETPYTESSAPIYIPDVSTEVYTPPASSSEAVSTPAAVYTPPVVTAEVPAYSAPAYSAPPVEVSKEDYTPAPVPSAPAYSAPAHSAPAHSAPAHSAPAHSAPAHSAPAASSKVVSSKPAKPTHGSTGHGYGSYSQTGRIVTKGEKWAITYTPYSAGGDCKSASEVQTDISKIAGMGFTTIRSYSTDCGVFENVVPACQQHGLKIIFGIFLTGGGSGGKGPFSAYADEQLQAIIKNAPKDSIAMVIVGNEYLFNGYGTAEELSSYIDHVRDQFIGAGFPSDIAFTTTEPVDVWESKGAALCSHIDVFAVQIHPYFTSKVSAPEAGEFAKEQLALAAAVCPEAAAKGQYITEIGWPHAGNVNGNAVPGKSEQKQAMDSIFAKVGTEACVFSFQDDLWKAPGSLNVEQSFGWTGY